MGHKHGQPELELPTGLLRAARAGGPVRPFHPRCWDLVSHHCKHLGLSCFRDGQLIHSLLLQKPRPAALWRSQPQHWMTNPCRLTLRRCSAARPTWCHHSFLRINSLTAVCLLFDYSLACRVVISTLPIQTVLFFLVWFAPPFFFFPGCREHDIPEEGQGKHHHNFYNKIYLLGVRMRPNFFLTYEKQEPGDQPCPVLLEMTLHHHFSSQQAAEHGPIPPHPLH